MYMVLPPRRNASQVTGNGVFDASTKMLIPSMLIPRLSSIGDIASLEYIKSMEYSNNKSFLDR